MLDKILLGSSFSETGAVMNGDSEATDGVRRIQF